MRSKNTPYMTSEWKNATRKKRKYSRRFAKNPTQENLQLKKKWRNIATKLRKRSIKHYWKLKTDNANNNPSEFYKVFKPFLDSKAKAMDSNVISLEINGQITKDHTEVVNSFAKYFGEAAKGIGDPELLSLTEDQLEDQESVCQISNKQ